MANNKKKRVPIPADVSARVQFTSDRTCCVCRIAGKRIQIHHMDGDPSNNDPHNLAVLCTDCHDETQITGGFGRKLNSDQILLYRDDWYQLVAQTRAQAAAEVRPRRGGAPDVRLVTSMADAYRANGEIELLALYYDKLGNVELRDKCVDEVLAREASDSTVVFLRGIQGRTELIPADVLEREEARYAKQRSPLQRARFYKRLGRHQDAAVDYVRGIELALTEERVFSAAYYLKELAKSDIAKELFILALRQAAEKDDLWWQVRALEELGWKSELKELVLEHADEIEASGPYRLRIHLARARGQEEEELRLRVEEARRTARVSGAGGGAVIFRGPDPKRKKT